MTRKDELPSGLPDIYRWYENTRKAAQNADVSALIRSRLENETREDERKVLYGILSTEYSMQKNTKMAEETLKQLVTEYPDDVRGWIQLTEHYLYLNPESDLAFGSSVRSLQSARASGKFYREACGVRARLALASRRYDVLNEALREIVTYGIQPGAVDIGVERDFIDRAPKEAIGSDLKDSYEALYASYWRKV